MKQQEKLIVRYSAVERLNHWIVVFCFIMLALSGLALFYPSFFWLTGVFGTPTWARIAHPFFGVVMFIGFTCQFFRYFHHNFFDAEDIKWMKAVISVLKGHEVGDIGKYNGGQKGMFWLMSSCMITLMVTGVLAWYQYFGAYVPVPVRRFALMLHAGSAVTLIAGIIVHAYAALWVRGTIRAMVEGVVSYGWARKSHPRWYREVLAKKGKRDKREH